MNRRCLPTDSSSSSSPSGSASPPRRLVPWQTQSKHSHWAERWKRARLGGATQNARCDSSSLTPHLPACAEVERRSPASVNSPCRCLHQSPRPLQPSQSSVPRPLEPCALIRGLMSFGSQSSPCDCALQLSRPTAKTCLQIKQDSHEGTLMLCEPHEWDDPGDAAQMSKNRR